MRRSTLSVLAGLLFALSPSVAAAQGVDVARNVEPVVLAGADVPAWSGPAMQVTCQPYPNGALSGERSAHNSLAEQVPPATGVDVDQIAAYRWTGVRFQEVPVQVDEMYYYCLSNPTSDFAFYSGTDKELSYAWDGRGQPDRYGVESWKKTAGQCTSAFPPGESSRPDPVPTLDNDDEIVFMASDASTLFAPPGAARPLGITDMQQVAIADPLDPTVVRYVYLALRPGGSSFGTHDGYVSYDRDADADEWIDRFSIARDDPEILGVSNTGYGPDLDGDVCRTAVYPGYPAVADGEPRASTDRFVRDGVTITTDAYRVKVSGRWMFRDLHVAQPGQPGVYGPDLIDRWKGRAFQQSPDSQISLVGFEDEQVNWEANSALLGELAGPVRAIREIWGADSGTNVTKRETFYRDAVVHRYFVRVHPIPADGLYTSWEYNRDRVGTYYNTIKTEGVPIDGENDDAGNVDGVGTFAAYFDVSDPTFSPPSAILNWEQVSGHGSNGSLVYIIEIKGFTSLENPAVVPYYRDDACLDEGTGDDPVPRPWPGDESGNANVKNGYCAAAGGSSPCAAGEYEALACTQKQGLHGAHGVHYFFTSDTDNAFSPETTTEIDSQQWQFAVPTAAPTNVGQAHGNVVIAPLQAVVTPYL